MKLKVQKVSVKNFLSVGSNEVVLDYRTGFHAVMGKVVGKETSNGVGKSALFTDGLVFGLYGKSIRGLKMDEMLNSVIGEKCVVKVWIKINEVEYRVERGIKPGFLRVYKGDADEPEELGAKKETQKNFETILGVTYTSFINMITLNINTSESFFKMDAKDKRQLLEDIMNLSVYGRMFDTIKKDFNESRNNKKVLDEKFRSAKDLFTEKKETYNKIEEYKTNFESDKSNDLKELNEKLEDLKTKKSEYESKIPDKDFKAILSNIQAKMGTIKEDLAKITTNISNNTENRDKKQSKLNKIQKNPICPLCNTPADNEHVQEHINELKSDIESLNESNENLSTSKKSLNEQYKDLRTKADKAEAAIEKVETLTGKLASVNSDITNTEENIKKTEEREFDVKDVITKEEVGKAMKRAKISKKELDDEAINMVYGAKLKEIFGDKGIKNYIIRKVLPTLNKKMNEYLSMLNATYTIKFDEELKESLKSRSCDQFSYNNFSDGEKKRIDIALMFTLLDIAKTRSSIDCNVFILDEILDSSMCSDGISTLITFLKTDFKQKYPNLCTYIITHKSEIREDNFDTIVELVKENSFTRIDNIKECDTVIQL